MRNNLSSQITLSRVPSKLYQTTDCESEINGLMTYDRKVIKMDVDKVCQTNQEIINTLK